jgi:paired amphipathic helix protein Sin3a
MRQWREILGWDDSRERESWLRESQEMELTAWARGPGSVVAGVVLERPGRKDLSVRYGSYRKLSSSVPFPLFPARSLLTFACRRST